MKKILILLALGALLSCKTTTLPESETKERKNGVVIEVMKSKMVTTGKIEEREKQLINIYLPPEYSTNPDKRFPVIYFLPGFGESNTHISSRSYFINQYYEENNKPQFIFVEPNGQSKLGGAFYWNSEATGNWEDYIIKEVIPLIDSKYRTINSKESRGLAGFSMGGTGTINLGLKYPDLFNAIYAFSPGILAEGDLQDLKSSWGNDLTYFKSYGAAASPNLNIDYPYAEFPETDRVVKNWYSIFGDQKAKVENYINNIDKLKAIRIQVNKDDSYGWIPTGCEYMDKILTENSIDHESVYGMGGHTLPALLVRENLIDFFSQNLNY